MGDEGKMYVSAEVLPVYKSMVLHADLIVPNQYEVEYVYFCIPWMNFPTE